jgi:hypothetical protein
MKHIKRWLTRLIADDIRNGGEIAKALREGQEATAKGAVVNVGVKQSEFQDAVMEAIATGRRYGRL